MLDGRSGASGFNEGGKRPISTAECSDGGRGSGFKGAGSGKARENPAPKSFEKDLDDEIPFITSPPWVLHFALALPIYKASQVHTGFTVFFSQKTRVQFWQAIPKAITARVRPFVQS